MLLCKSGFVRKPQKYVFMVLIKIHNFEQYYTCKRKPKHTQGGSAAPDDDYTRKLFNTNEY